jgi:hypothetical protein
VHVYTAVAGPTKASGYIPKRVTRQGITTSDITPVANHSYQASGADRKDFPLAEGRTWPQILRIGDVR